MPSGWKKKIYPGRTGRGGSSNDRHTRPMYGYDLVGGGASTRIRVGNSITTGKRCPCHPAFLSKRNYRVARMRAAKVDCRRVISQTWTDCRAYREWNLY